MTISQIRKGRVVGVPCEIEPGPFDDEFLVMVDTATGPVSGFARSEFLRPPAPGQGYIVAEIVEIGTDTVTVRLPGSFFTTAGIASVAAAGLHQAT